MLEGTEALISTLGRLGCNWCINNAFKLHFCLEHVCSCSGELGLTSSPSAAQQGDKAEVGGLSRGFLLSKKLLFREKSNLSMHICIKTHVKIKPFNYRGLTEPCIDSLLLRKDCFHLV